MAISLDAISLSPSLLWIDEFDWTPIEQVESRSITGNLILQTGVRAGGRPITLKAGDTYGWLARSTVLALQAKLAGTPPFVLTIGSHTFSVAWRHAGGKPIEARPVVDYADPLDADPYIVTLNFLVIGV
jgi:hypothetical protein